MNLNFRRWAMKDFANQVGALSADELELWCAIPPDTRPAGGVSGEERWEGEGGGLATPTGETKG